MRKNIIRTFFSNANILVILLCIYAMFACTFQLFVDYNTEVNKLILGIDVLIAIILFVFFWVEFFNAKDKKKFMRYGWIILLSSLPAEGFLAEHAIITRAIRLILLIWILYSNRFDTPSKVNNNQMITTAMICFCIVIISTILILQVENVPDSKIKTTGDAIYWAIITISTVGYGDLYPVTPAGRCITIILIFSGVSIFVSAARSFAAWTSRENKKEVQDN